MIRGQDHLHSLPSPDNIKQTVKQSLAEDVGSGDLTALIIDVERTVHASLISRQSAVLCGTAWFNEVFYQLDPEIVIEWQCSDGDSINTNQRLCEIYGKAQPILTGERSALNWLQTLSGTATLTRSYVDRLSGSSATVLDTRKTIPGLRIAQKYAVRCGGGHNHRIGLYDGILIKENHLRSGDSIALVLERAREHAPREAFVEIEVDTLGELKQALDAGAAMILLDNFTVSEMRAAVLVSNGRAKLEASGNINFKNIREVADTGVDYISIGALTKNVAAIDLSLQFEHT